jgi:hypothetical protein
MKHPPQESDLIPSNLVVGSILGVIAAIAIGCLVAHAIGSWRSAELRSNPRAPAERLSGVPPEVVPPEVNAIETLPFSVDAQGLASHQVAEAWLSGYGWVDRGRRVIHIPIDVAFDAYLARLASAPGPAAPPRPGGAP